MCDVYVSVYMCVCVCMCICVCMSVCMCIYVCVYMCVCVYVCVCTLSRFSLVQLCVTPWAVSRQAPLSMGFPRQEYWSGLPCPPPGDLPDPGTKPMSLASPTLAGRFFTTSTTWQAQMILTYSLKR